MHDIAVIGAGPYGLSIAAHLAGEGLDFRIFGEPMQTWRHTMPQGMHLKSEGFASRLYDPAGALPLSAYCAERGIAYGDLGHPVAIGTFIDYGLAFQQRFVPMLEQRRLVALRRAADHFEAAFDDGEQARFRRVVLAVGISHYAHVAAPFDALPAALASHSSARSDYAAFAGREVAVVGAGASAIDCAIALADAGARVRLLARGDRLRFHNPPRERTLADRLRAPVTTIGPGWKSVALTRLPLLFHTLPQAFRHEVVRRYLGPAPCWFTRDQIEADVEVTTGAQVIDAHEDHGRCALTLASDAGTRRIAVDHVIAATGYRVDLARLAFLDPALRAAIATEGSTPRLSRRFESSVPGLHFVGASSANAFGSLVRFACGAEFTAGRLSRHLADTARRHHPTSVMPQHLPAHA